MRGPLAPAPIGHNAPPAATPFEAVAVHLDDLLTEARAWADGTPVATQAQADELSFLIDQLRKGGQAAEKLRKAEKQPHMDAARAVDERFRPLTEGAERAIAATKRTLGAWLEALDAKRRAEGQDGELNPSEDCRQQTHYRHQRGPDCVDPTPCPPHRPG